MGQHKTNPTAIAAAKGELQNKPPKKSKRQMDREIHAYVKSLLISKIFRPMKKKEVRDSDE